MSNKLVTGLVIGVAAGITYKTLEILRIRKLEKEMYEVDTIEPNDQSENVQ